MSIAYKVERAAVGEQDSFLHFFQVLPGLFPFLGCYQLGHPEKKYIHPCK